MELNQAYQIALSVMDQLRPYCDRIEIAGSIRRKKPFVKDIEIVAIPKPYSTGLLTDGIALVVEKWQIVKGDMQKHCKYTQRILPEGIKLDLFFADIDNWGYIFAIRTGSADYSHKVLATGWVKAGYKGKDGYLTNAGHIVPVREEEDLFKRIGIEYVPPEKRNLEIIKDNVGKRFCQNCEQQTNQEAIFINPDDTKEGMVWKCLNCLENAGWVNKKQ